MVTKRVVGKVINYALFKLKIIFCFNFWCRFRVINYVLFKLMVYTDINSKTVYTLACSEVMPTVYSRLTVYSRQYLDGSFLACSKAASGINDFKVHRLRDYKGFTLMELIIAMIVVSILTAGGLYVYSGLIGSANVSSVVQNISKLETAAQAYAQMNGDDFSGINSQTMQNDNLIPQTWNTASTPNNPYEAIPPNSNGFINGYGVAQSNTAGNYAIILYPGSTMTIAQALAICNNLEDYYIS